MRPFLFSLQNARDFDERRALTAEAVGDDLWFVMEATLRRSSRVEVVADAVMNRGRRVTA